MCLTQFNIDIALDSLLVFTDCRPLALQILVEIIEVVDDPLDVSAELVLVLLHLVYLLNQVISKVEVLILEFEYLMGQ